MQCYIDVDVFVFNDTATTEIYTLSLHDALPISIPTAAARALSELLHASLALGLNMRAVVIGRNSLIARVLRRHPETADWLFLAHSEDLADPSWEQGASCVVNCASDARLKSQPYDAAYDIDLPLA